MEIILSLLTILLPSQPGMKMGEIMYIHTAGRVFRIHTLPYRGMAYRREWRKENLWYAAARDFRGYGPLNNRLADSVAFLDKYMNYPISGIALSE